MSFSSLHSFPYKLSHSVISSCMMLAWDDDAWGSWDNDNEKNKPSKSVFDVEWIHVHFQILLL